MIKRLILNNFQRFKTVEIDLENGINAFVGESNEGKSALACRSLDFLLFKTIASSDNIHYGEKEMSVEAILIINNKEISLKRVKNQTNSYFIIDGLKLEKSGKKTGQQLLEEYHNIILSSLNIGQQHDPYYFITLTPVDAGKEIQSLFNTTHILKYMDNWRSEQKQIKSNISKNIKLSEDLTYRISKIEPLILDINISNDKLQNLENNIIINDKELILLKNYYNKFNRLIKLSSLNFNIVTVFNDIKLKYIENTKIINNLNTYKINLNKHIYYKDLLLLKPKLEIIISNIESKQIILNNLNKYLNYIKETNILYEKLNEIKEYLKDKSCPTCGQTLNY